MTVETRPQKRVAIPGRRLRVLYIQPGTTSFAGIERVVDAICNQLVEQYCCEFDLEVLYTSAHTNFPTEPRKYKAIRLLVKGRIELIRTYRQVIARDKYDLVVVPQVEPTVKCWIACLGRGQKLVMHLHGNPAIERMNFRSQIMFHVMDFLVLRRLAGIFGTSPRQIAAFKAAYPNDVPSFWVPNPVREFENAGKVDVAPRPLTFVNVGRFDYQKGQDILIDAFAKLHVERPDIRLKLVGFGKDEPKLRRQIEQLGLTKAISIDHYPTNPEIPLASSDIFVSTSRWEGWSLAICEALRFGLPVISTDCDFGPSDILIDGRLGRLVPIGSKEALVDAMRYYCDNIEVERGFSAFRKSAVDAYTAERVVHKHATALKSIA